MDLMFRNPPITRITSPKQRSTVRIPNIELTLQEDWANSSPTAGEDLSFHDSEQQLHHYVELFKENYLHTSIAVQGDHPEQQAETSYFSSSYLADPYPESFVHWIETEIANIFSTNLQTIFDKVKAGVTSPESLKSAIEAVNWSIMPAPSLRQAIEAALSYDLVNVARDLTNLGLQIHPTDEKLKSISRLLAQPRVIENNRPRREQLAASMEWLEHNSMNYRGQWVAISAGELIGNATSRQNLLDSIGDMQANCLITRIP